MSDETPKRRMKPVLILPKGELSEGDIKELRDNDFCVVEATDPDAVRFLEPPPQDYTAQEQAAIQLTRYIVSRNTTQTFYRSALVDMLAQFMIDGTPLATNAAPKRVRTVKTAGK